MKIINKLYMLLLALSFANIYSSSEPAETQTRRKFVVQVTNFNVTSVEEKHSFDIEIPYGSKVETLKALISIQLNIPADDFMLEDCSPTYRKMGTSSILRKDSILTDDRGRVAVSVLLKNNH